MTESGWGLVQGVGLVAIAAAAQGTQNHRIHLNSTPCSGPCAPGLVGQPLFEDIKRVMGCKSGQPNLDRFAAHDILWR